MYVNVLMSSSKAHNLPTSKWDYAGTWNCLEIPLSRWEVALESCLKPWCVQEPRGELLAKCRGAGGEEQLLLPSVPLGMAGMCREHHGALRDMADVGPGLHLLSMCAQQNRAAQQVFQGIPV